MLVNVSLSGKGERVMADIVHCPSCDGMVEWGNIVAVRINSIEWEIGCTSCKENGFMLVGFWFDPDSSKNDYVCSKVKVA